MLVDPERGPGGALLEGREPIPAARPIVEAALRAAASSGAALKVAPSVTVNVIALPSAKDSLHRNRGVALCDMESFWVARRCLRAGRPFAAVRAVFDAAPESLPPAPGLGSEPLLAVLRRRPALAFRLPGLGLRMWRVRRRLDPLARALVRELAGLEDARGAP